MTVLRCLKCLAKGTVTELNFRQNNQSDPAYYQCPTCGLKTYIDYGETASGLRTTLMPMPKPDLDKEEEISEEAQDNILEHYVRKRFVR